MANIRNLKKDINFVVGDIIEAVMTWQLANPEKDHSASETLIDDAINLFDSLIAKVNNKQVDDRKAQLAAVIDELETGGRALIDRFQALG